MLRSDVEPSTIKAVYPKVSLWCLREVLDLLHGLGKPPANWYVRTCVKRTLLYSVLGRILSASSNGRRWPSRSARQASLSDHPITRKEWQGRDDLEEDYRARKGAS